MSVAITIEYDLEDLKVLLPERYHERLTELWGEDEVQVRIDILAAVRENIHATITKTIHGKVAPREGRYSLEPLRKGVFTIESIEGKFYGWTSGETWNGWACPYFSKETTDKILALMGEAEAIDYARFEGDSYFVCEQAVEGELEYEGFDVYTTDGMQHVYSIGARYWIWSEVE